MILSALVGILTLGHGGAAQDAQQTERFLGKWEAKVNATVACTIEFRTSGAGVSGSIADCKIHTDANGKLEEPEPPNAPSAPSPLANLRIASNVLLFEFRDEEGSAPVKFEMRLVKDGVADIIIDNARDKIKPIRFIRASAPK